MIQRRLLEIEQMVIGEGLQTKYHNYLIKGVSISSKTIRPGNLFIPIVRLKNGHDYVEEAIQQGAIASLWEKSQPNPPKGIPLIFVDDTLIALQQLARSYRNQLSVHVIGVTGSNGKTTTKDLINSVLGTTYKVHKTKGNLNSQIGLPLTILEIEEDCEIVVLEMGMSERGQIQRLSEIAQPNLAVITMIGQSHILTLGSREAIADAKLEIVMNLKEQGLLIYNGDEPLLKEKIHALPNENQIKFIRIGESSSNDIYPVSMKEHSTGIDFTLNDEVTYFIPLHGKHNVYNAIIAIKVGQQFNLDQQSIQQGLKQVELTEMRFQMLKGKLGTTVINDAWNASPSSVKAAIETFEQLVGYEKKIIVLGDMLELGQEEENYHRNIGQILNPNTIDYIFTIGERAKMIAQEAKFRYTKGTVKAFLTKEEAITEILSVCNPEDAVLVKGSRGMTLEEVVRKLI
ncbi:UDP-N-acetylmuramoyl-tripeptide--D-alanyl-D-alanine ligase [Bacillus pseudomycoides]|uniref:UDP-N-acetylmuramoyl-tripeptide--D-alanyl-D-alanine ligase n=1 Tax=Bacillus pseudomycoides TaxID=64104 RepID=A0AA91VA70_9BACI|nr:MULTISPECIES: UDP-N-acetylmuramoyl-tripeptide--D-alanyl-D-alanine ligase [Bacillus]PEB54455.1 UDP-N-acetylmuramoyl-tripeptide--D-alanyl-D-alanine ligase [Bacillus sp. AFS098217]PED81435.1 UDP-N-acetylmuramoyl-tripeptide--D-alanyl-D-alanine ligase [Bacillus pseudomycoides]PEU06674.1 UDP-N-acetylmuramoyl-tripeptide--D-alanyl-D-alanine ligase [Bacillus sp. AFS019443]PEU19126.1 UDP-N-acetylmuramoyl-tripeptide--D-alanyl-D-alanine ligase [Bacillus sp. AFS014408]PFW63235.1 UDP-N-acetylmuramoyl-tri